MPLYDAFDLTNIEALRTEGLDPHSDDDSVLGTTFVYCAEHMRAHTSGWCTVYLLAKYRLEATTETEATAEARTKGFELYSDPRPCTHCGTPINNDRKAIGTPYGEGYHCAQAPGRDTSHIPAPRERASAGSGTR